MTVTPNEDSGALEGAATALVSRLVDVGIDGFGPLDSAIEVAERAKKKNRNIEAAIDDLVTQHTKQAAAGGFVTGLGGFVTLPVALPANILGFYLVATRMVAGIAHLRGYDVNQPEVRAAVLLSLVGSDNRTVLQKAGFKPSQKIAEVAMGQLPKPALMVINKGVGFHLLAQTGKRSLTRLGRFVPLAGGVFGAGVDWWLQRKVAATARKEFTAKALTSGESDQV